MITPGELVAGPDDEPFIFLGVDEEDGAAMLRRLQPMERILIMLELANVEPFGDVMPALWLDTRMQGMSN